MIGSLFFNSLFLATAVTLLAHLFGAIVAVAALSLRRGPWIAGIAAIATFMLPGFLISGTWIYLFGKAGLVRWLLPFNLYSLSGAAFLLALSLWPVAWAGCHAAWQEMDGELFEADPALRGRSVLQYLLWPYWRRRIWSSAIVVFVLALNNFTIPALLQLKVLPAAVWVDFNTTFDYAAAFKSGWPLVVVPFLALTLNGGKQIGWWSAGSGPGCRAVSLGPTIVHLTRFAGFAVIGGSLIVPLATLLFNNTTWRDLAPAAGAGLGAGKNSAAFAFFTATLCLVTAGLTIRRKKPRFSWLLFFIPGILWGIGLIRIFNRPGLVWFYQSAGIVVFGLSLRYLVVARSVVNDAFQNLNGRMLDLAKLDGLGFFRGWRHLYCPAMGASLFVAWYVVYVFALGDVETLVLILPPGGETIGLRIFNLLHYGHNSQVNALCLLLLLLAVGPLLVFFLLRYASAWRMRKNFLLFVGLATFAVSCTRNPPASGVSPNSIFSSVQVIGNRGTGWGEFNKPRSVAVDHRDNLYVVDMTGRVQKFSPEGKYLLSWQMPQTDLGKPKGMSCDAEGNVIVIEPHYQRLNHFTPAGKIVRQWGEKGDEPGRFAMPRGVAVNSRGEILVSEYSSVERIQIFDQPGGKLIRGFGRPGNGPGDFNRPEGLGIGTGDRIYVADSCNHRIQVFDATGKFLRMHGRAGTGPGEFSYPYDVRLDEQDRQYVCEFGNSRIQIFDAQDRFIESIGGAGVEPGTMNNPWAIALDSKGNLYVADAMNHRVQKFIRRHPAIPARGVGNPAPKA